MNLFVNNRQVIKNLKLNTGTVAVPVWTALDTASEIAVNTEMEAQDFYVFVDALKRKVTTGANIEFNTTVKIDMLNAAVLKIIDEINALVSTGDIAPFNTYQMQFDMLNGYNAETKVLKYQTYQADNMAIEIAELGGAAEEVGDFELNLHLNGPATEVTE